MYSRYSHTDSCSLQRWNGKPDDRRSHAYSQMAQRWLWLPKVFLPRKCYFPAVRSRNQVGAFWVRPLVGLPVIRPLSLYNTFMALFVTAVHCACCVGPHLGQAQGFGVLASATGALSGLERETARPSWASLQARPERNMSSQECYNLVSCSLTVTVTVGNSRCWAGSNGIEPCHACRKLLSNTPFCGKLVGNGVVLAAGSPIRICSLPILDLGWVTHQTGLQIALRGTGPAPV